MHEMSLISGVFDVINSTLTDHPQVTKVVKVKLKIGEFTNAQPEALEFAFQAFAKNTSVEGAQLEMEIVPVIARCAKCHHQFKVAGLTFCCPYCQDKAIELLSGRELVLESLEVE